MIDVFLVDADPAALAAIQTALVAYPDLRIVGTAHNAQQALASIAQLKPAVLCCEAILPGQDALVLVSDVMEKQPTPILIVSAAVHDNPALIADLQAAGVVDVLAKPTQYRDYENVLFSKELARKLKVLSGVMVFRRKAQPTTLPASHFMDPLPPPQKPLASLDMAGGPKLDMPVFQARRSGAILVVGASTGGPHALETVLAKLPADYPLPIVCVQHISQGFLEPFIVWLAGKVKLAVSIAKAGEQPKNGHIYFAPDHANLEFDSRGHFRFSQAADYLHYPCINVTFHNVARHYGRQTIAVLMTGMGEDGADGLRAIAQAGGVTIAQDEASSTVFGMPKAAIENGAAQKVLNLEQIADEICRLAK